MEEHVLSVERFHTMLATQSSWLAATEKSLRAFKVPSKLMNGVQVQMCSLKVCIITSSHFLRFTYCLGSIFWLSLANSTIVMLYRVGLVGKGIMFFGLSVCRILSFIRPDIYCYHNIS